MRLGAVLFHVPYDSPEEWVTIVKERGYRAVATPIDETASADEIAAYRQAAEDNDLVMAEVGVWRNTCADDEATRKANIATAKAKLHLADELGARCAVNITGERSRRGAGDDLTEEAFDRVVEVVREIIDDVKPTRTYYTLETMPYMLPDSVEMYDRLVEAIDRERFGVHCDPVNLAYNPRTLYNSGDMIRYFFKVLGPKIRSCHAKDLFIDGSRLFLHIDEVIPGQGALDYRTFVAEINKLDPDLPLMIEHIDTDEGYRQAADYLRSVEASL